VLRPCSLKVAIEELRARLGDPPWAERIVANDQFVVTVICQAPGHRNDRHYHVVEECWYVHEGDRPAIRVAVSVAGEPRRHERVPSPLAGEEGPPGARRGVA
jgi:hypothetical protein